MSSLLAAQHRIRKLMDTMTISDSSDNTVNIVIERLMPLYKEYQYERKETLQATMKQALLVITKPPTLTPQPVILSLNQSMNNAYTRNGSKRSRPEELAVADTEETTDVAKQETNNNTTLTKEPSVDGKGSTKTVPASTKKKRAPTSKSDGDNVNPLQVHSYCFN